MPLGPSQRLNASGVSSTRAHTATGQRKQTLRPKESKEVRANENALLEESNIKLNQLLKQVKSLQLEKDKLKELIEELRKTNELYTQEREQVE